MEDGSLHRCAGTVDEGLYNALRSVLSHWREFGGEDGFDELVETSLAPFYDEGMPIETERKKGAECDWCENGVMHLHPEDLEPLKTIDGVMPVRCDPVIF